MDAKTLKYKEIFYTSSLLINFHLLFLIFLLFVLIVRNAITVLCFFKPEHFILLPIAK